MILKDKLHCKQPHLVETSEIASTSIEDLDFCKDSIVFPKVEMTRLLKTLKEPSGLLKDDRRSMLEKLCDILLPQSNAIEEDTCCSQLATHAMMPKNKQINNHTRKGLDPRR